MGKTHKKLLLWAGIFAAISSAIGFLSFLIFNLIIPDRYAVLLNYLQYDVGLKSSFGSFKTYFDIELLCMGLINLLLAIKYISYSKMTIGQLTKRSSSMLLMLLINAFCGGNIISLILVIISMLKPITPEFNEKTIKEIDRDLLDRNPNTVSMIIKIKQDKLNGIITEQEYIEKLNKILEDEARRFM